MGGLTKVMIIRHAEKPDPKGKPHGVTIDGIADGNSLTVRGWQRAGALATLFAPSNGVFATMLLASPSTIYASSPRGGSERPLQTIKPLVKKTGAKLVETFAKGEEAELAGAVLREEGVVLISWQHERIIEIATHLTAGNPPQEKLPNQWPDDRFDVVWVFTPPVETQEAWGFAQVPQLLLGGDVDAPIGAD